MKRMITAALLLLHGILSYGQVNTYHDNTFVLSNSLLGNQSFHYIANDSIDLVPHFWTVPYPGKYNTFEIGAVPDTVPPYGNNMGLSPDAPNDVDEGRVGTYPMEFDVNQSGAATLNIPLEFPEGINGMTPHLSLNYNSQAGNGILGLGWSLGGMSKISRVPYKYEYDDIAQAVSFTNEDDLSLDGNLLRRDANGNYYPEIYDYSVVMPINRNDLSRGFKVLKRDGKVYWYEKGYYLQDDLPTPIEWHLTKVEDPDGNMMEFTYINDTEEGTFYPNTITYAKDGQNNYHYMIEFEYSPEHYRPDTQKKYFSGTTYRKSGFSFISNVLWSIKCSYCNDNEIISVIRYDLDYKIIGNWHTKVLFSVRKVVDMDNELREGNLDHYAPLTFEWCQTDYSLSCDSLGMFNTHAQSNDGQLFYKWEQQIAFSARFENTKVGGDSKYENDIVHLMKDRYNYRTFKYHLHIFRSNNTVGAAGNLYQYDDENDTYDVSEVNTILHDVGEIVSFQPTDVDGDGLNEILCIGKTHDNYLTFYLIRNNGQDVFSMVMFNELPNANSYSDFQVADFNGDGLSDLFYLYNGIPEVHISKSNNPFEVPCPSSSYVPFDHRIVIGDFNGDKKEQILILYKENNICKSYLLSLEQLPNGNYYFPSQVNVDSDMAEWFFDHPDTERYRLCQGDFNGDGKTDVMLLRSDAWRFYFSKGNRLFTEAVLMQDPEVLTNAGIHFYTHEDFRLAMVNVTDFDGDGCDDISIGVADQHYYNGDYFYKLYRRDYLIRPRRDDVLVCIKKIGPPALGNGASPDDDYCIDSVMSAGNLTGDFPYLCCMGNHKGKSSNEIMFMRLASSSVKRDYQLFLFNTGCLTNPICDAITKVTDPLGATTEIEYCPASWQIPIPYMSKDNSRAIQAVLPFFGNLNVVSKVRKEMQDNFNNQEKIFRTTKYHFDQAYTHTRGKGFLGFSYIQKYIDGQSYGNNANPNIFIVDQYSVDADHFIMKPESNEKAHYHNNGNKTIFEKTSYTYSFLTSFPDELVPVEQQPDLKLFYPYLSCSKTERNSNEILIPMETDSISLDNYGNVAMHVRRFGSSQYERNSYSFYNNVMDDCRILGLPKTETCRKQLYGSNPVLSETTYEYDTIKGHLLSKCREPNHPDKMLTETYRYDEAGNCTSITRIAGEERRIDSMRYNVLGRLETAINAAGHETSYEYYERTGKPKRVTTPGKNGASDGLTTTYEYDRIGNLVRTIYPDGTDLKQRIAWIDFDPNSPAHHPDTPDFGGPIYFTWSKKMGGAETYTFFDQLNRKLREVTTSLDGKKIYTDYKYYETNGLLKESSSPYFSQEGENPQFTTYTYDFLERPLEITRPDGAQTTHQYHSIEETTCDFDGQSTKLTLSASGLVTNAQNNGTTNVEYTYYGDGKVKSTLVGPAETKYYYDVNRNPDSIIDPSLGKLTYDYNAFGELAESSTPRAHTFFRYDALGRMTNRTDNDGVSTWSYDHDFIGALDRTDYNPIEGPSVVETYAYDDYGNLIEQTQKIGDEAELQFKYGFNAYGQRSTITYPSGRKVKYYYDRATGFLKMVRDLRTSRVLWKATATDRWGNTSQSELGNVILYHNYDSITGLVNGIQATRGNQRIFNQEYHWQTNGNLGWRKDALLNLYESFGYDGFNRLKTITTKTYDGSATYGNQSVNYDAIGNITAKSDVGTIYNYGESDFSPYAVTSIEDLSNSDLLAGLQGLTYTCYDKLATASQDGKRLVISYGIDRQRVVQTFDDGGSVRTKRYFTPLYEAVTEGGVTKNYHYLTAANGLFAIFVTSSNGEEAMYYTMKDHQGSLAAVIQPDGDVERLSYDAWGRRRNADGFGYDNVPIPMFDRGFTLHEHYDGFGLINMNGRMYDPAVGRMLSPDIVIQQEHNSQAYNRYSYCFNNPLRFTDPSGYVVTVPPEFEKYYMPEYIGEYDTYKKKLEEIGAENVTYNTDFAEGKSTTTLSWMIGEDKYQMEVIEYSFPLLSQLYANSCMASSLTMQALRFYGGSIVLSTSSMFKNLISGMSMREATETALMDSQTGAYKNGLRGGEAIELFATASNRYSNTIESHPFYYDYSEFRNTSDCYFEGFAYNEMKYNNSAVLFSFYGDGYSHTMNVKSSTEFSFNGKASGHDLLLWDSDATHGGGIKSFNTFSQKFGFKFGIIPIK